jgi:hypothetical protein
MGKLPIARSPKQVESKRVQTKPALDSVRALAAANLDRHDAQTGGASAARWSVYICLAAAMETA